MPSDFAFEEESSPPPVAEANPCVENGITPTPCHTTWHKGTPWCPMTTPGATKRRKQQCCKPLTISGPHCHRRRRLLCRWPCPLFSLLFSLGQTRVVVVVAVVVAAAPPPMPPPLLVHPPEVVPRPALVTTCHQNPCLMGLQPAGSQGRKRPGQRSVLAPRVPARGHATSGSMMPMLEAPPLPSLLSLSLSLSMSVVCNKGKGHYLWASGGPHNPFCMHGY